MLWSLFRQSSRPARSARPRFRPSLEVLEGRQLLSVSVIPQKNPVTGLESLLVRTDGTNDTVTIMDNSTNHTTTVIADGKMSTFAEQFALFDLELMSKKDTLTFDLVGAYNGRHADIRANLDKGENHFIKASQCCFSIWLYEFAK